MNRRSFLGLLGFGLLAPRLPAAAPPVVQESVLSFQTEAGWRLEQQMLMNYRFGLIESFDRELFADDMEGVIR